jgi:hypothetical protein
MLLLRVEVRNARTANGRGYGLVPQEFLNGSNVHPLAGEGLTQANLPGRHRGSPDRSE